MNIIKNVISVKCSPKMETCGTPKNIGRAEDDLSLANYRVRFLIQFDDPNFGFDGICLLAFNIRMVDTT